MKKSSILLNLPPAPLARASRLCPRTHWKRPGVWKKTGILLALMTGLCAYGQTNTASVSGNIGKCEVWGYPYTLYNTAGASQTVNDGITVTVDQNRNIGAVNLTGSGAMNLSGANGITLSGAGGEINCRWDIAAGGSYTIVNNDGNPDTNVDRNIGNFFTAPYNGNYGWVRGTGWTASLSGANLNGSINLRRSSDGVPVASSIYYRNEAGSCGLLAPPSQGEIWRNSFGSISLAAGNSLFYSIGTGYDNAPGCTNTTLNATRGSAIVVYMN